MLSRLNAAIAREWLTRNRWPVERVSVDDEIRAQGVMVRYTDNSFPYTDATSFALMERRGLRTGFAFDRHVRQYGFALLEP